MHGDQAVLHHMLNYFCSEMAESTRTFSKHFVAEVQEKVSPTANQLYPFQQLLVFWMRAAPVFQGSGEI